MILKTSGQGLVYDHQAIPVKQKMWLPLSIENDQQHLQEELCANGE